MQTIEVAFTVPEKNRCRLGLAGLMAALQIFGMFRGVVCANPHNRIPSIRDLAKPRIKGAPQRDHRFRKRVSPVFVFSASETVASHDDPTAKWFVLIVAFR